MGIKPFGFSRKLLKDFLMTKVQAIEISDGEDAMLMLFLAVVQAADNLHVCYLFLQGRCFFKALILPDMRHWLV